MARTIVLDDATASALFLALERSTEAPAGVVTAPPSPPVAQPPISTPTPAPQPAAPAIPGGFKTIEIDWNSPAQPVLMRSAEAGGFGKGDTLVIHFRTGPIPSGPNNYGRLSIVEFGAGGPSPRTACLSRAPGDMQNGYKQQSIGPTFVFLVGTAPDQYAAVLPPLTDWYCNVQNDPNSNETAYEVQVTLAKPRGT